MLLVPISNHVLHHTKYQASPPDRFAVHPTAVYPSGSFTIINPFLGAPGQTLVTATPHFLQDVMALPHREMIPQCAQVSNTRSDCSSASPGIRRSPVTPCPHDLEQTKAKQKQESGSILFNLLNETSEKRISSGLTSHSCGGKFTAGVACGHVPSGVRRMCVGLRNPVEISKSASKVMKKISTFVKNLESFRNMHINDQDLLFTNSWAKLFVLGMAQERILFDVVQFGVQDLGSDYSCQDTLTWSLLDQKEAAKADEASKLRGFVRRCMELNLTPVEYAYFMGTVLFDYDIPGLQQRDVVAYLQAEALHALAEYRGDVPDSSSIFLAEHHQQMRLAQILLALPALKSIKTQAVADLFFNDISVMRPATLRSLLTE